MKSDIEIAQGVKLKAIKDVAKSVGIEEKYLEYYGQTKAKINLDIWEKLKDKKDGKLVLVTAMTPTPAGEGKTTITVGLGQALWSLGKKSMICLREPSLGPIFGIKGGAAGGGYAQVLPMEDINLHFTGDLHAVGAANNLLASLIDNHIHHGNSLQIDLRKISWRRCVDMSDRSLRSIVIALGTGNGLTRQDGYDITVASEVMAILCLAKDIKDLKKRLEKMIVATNTKGEPVTAKDLKAAGALTVLLKDAIKPNLVQTVEGSPAFIHGGPFANIAHGCNSIIATKTALKLADIVVTEAGFGADLGAEKFLDIKCRIGKLQPSAVVLVGTIRALKHHGKGELEAGLANLGKHIENMQKFGLPMTVAINKFSSDTAQEINLVKKYCQERGVNAIMAEVWAKGAKGGQDLAKEVLNLVKQKNNFKYMYDPKLGLEKSVEAIATKVYGANGVTWSAAARQAIKKYEKWNLGSMLICMAKTQASISDNPKVLGRPENFKIKVREIRLSAGAGFFVVIAGSIMTMPGLPKEPAADNIDINDQGVIKGLF